LNTIATIEWPNRNNSNKGCPLIVLHDVIKLIHHSQKALIAPICNSIGRQACISVSEYYV